MTGRKATRSGQEHATLRAGFPLDAARTTDLLERPLPDQRADLPVNGEQNLSVTPRPFQIRTLRLTPAP
ncbi:glycosyl hydrolase-related protein [Streptomyces coeruleorubidus]|uniref:glycosyl hydrolase-related protein n=1 Tax=Streptomyces coeruleorubidus TaxID=116188 RepID=UPI0033B817BD